MNIAEFNAAGKRLKELLILRFSPIALRVLREGDVFPEKCVRPSQCGIGALAMCQAFSKVRREKAHLVMLKEDHWCLWPLVSYGMIAEELIDPEELGTKLFVRDPQQGVDYFKSAYPRLDNGARPPVIGFAIAPLEECTFAPDLISVYCRPAQIRTFQMAAKFQSGKMLDLLLDPVDSCVHSTIPVLNGKDYNITFPDPGEYERALAGEDEVIFTLRAEKLAEILGGVEFLSNAGFGYAELRMDMKAEFSRPQFYNDTYEKWGLPTGKTWGE
ncbi:MAG: DUF169 domain-containing protein [Oscillospiraceae bacterium]|jgi:uncharacterized protein (DUF169 family)|nr:DUF169 domain-containing protein [Oscillospiraceae bacterium]